MEYTGYQTPIVNSPVFTITAITHRRDPIVQGVFAGKPPCETDTLWRELEESDAFDTLRRRFPLLVALHRPPSLARDFVAVLQINPKRARPGIVKTLMLATSAVMLRLKYVICVDDDIDIYNVSDVMYAVATRCDPKVDVTLIEGTMTSWLIRPAAAFPARCCSTRRKRRASAANSPITRTTPWSAPGSSSLKAWPRRRTRRNDFCRGLWSCRVRVDDVTQFATQLLNGLQLGVALFLMSAGLTLVLGIMNFVNLRTVRFS